MSVTYHAYQNINYRFKDYEAISEQWETAFSGYDPARVAEILHLKYDDQFLYIDYYGEKFRLSLAMGFLQKEVRGEWVWDLYFNECMSVYHLLTYVKDCPRISGEWVMFDCLDGVVSRRRTGPDPLLAPFSKTFSGRVPALREACRRLGGMELDLKGDLAYRFEAFPQIQLQLIFWDADEDFPAQTQIYVDACVGDYVHFETLGCIMADLFQKLYALDAESANSSGV